MKQSIAIIGGGSSALLLAAFLDTSRFEVTVYERNKTLGRKFLVAGKGGFNLTHSEAMPAFTKRYTPKDFLQEALLYFDNQQLRLWLEKIGIPTFIGSSKRVYPTQGIKPIEVLNRILQVLKNKGVVFKTKHHWTGWNDENQLIFNKNTLIDADYHVFALGGGSWKVTGSDGHWSALFAKKNIKTTPFLAANCAYHIKWANDFIQNHQGKPLKNIAISCEEQTQKGEAVITEFGLEGNAIYALSPAIQQQLNSQQKATIFLDLKPMLSLEDISNRLLDPQQKMSNILRKKLKLSPPQIQLIKSQLSKEQFLNKDSLALHIKKLPLNVYAPAPIDQAISTMGGIALHEITPKFELQKIKHTFCIGEMLDWNAPTGGYLLQACFSMGAYLAQYLNGIAR